MTTTMTMTHIPPVKRKVVAVGLVLLLAACGGGGAAFGLNALGSVFGQAFAADANSAPLADPATAGLVVNPNIDPFNP